MLIASARDLLDRGDLDAAQRAVQEAFGIDARHPEALAAHERMQARRRELAEAQAAEVAAAVETALASDDLAAADTAFARLQELAPGSPAIASLQDRIQARREQVDPELLVRNALGEAARLIREMRPERVPEVLARVRAVAPQHPELAKLEAQAQKVLGARDVRARVRELVDRARQLQFRGKHAEALVLAEEAVGLAPDDGPTLRLRDDLAEQIQGARRPGRR
jgi:tetratricopeptide (TPR) repeat protein